MYERSYGKRYDELGGKYVTAAEIAKLMRRDIKELIGKGELPGGMRNYSVRVHNYSGGRSIRIEAKDLDGLSGPCPGYRTSDLGGQLVCWACEGGRKHDALNEEGARVKKLLQEVWSAYNHDGSDVMTDYFDVNYYGGVEV
jgi:hypothetical protein